jgi:Domain of unknown function (DUF1990)
MPVIREFSKGKAMNEPQDFSPDDIPRNADSWAQEVDALEITRVPTGAINLNMDGRQVVGPLQGFGQLWQKTYQVRLPGVTLTPAEVMQRWKTSLPQLMPPEQRFFPALKGIEPGELVLINASLTGMPISTGVMVIYADDESFTFMTPQGHPESGWNTFSVSSEEECIVCQIQSLARANDPIYEIGFRLFGATEQEKIWYHVLTELAALFQVNGQMKNYKTCIDPRLQWSEAKNIWQNAAIRTVLYTIFLPLRFLNKSKKQDPKKPE